MAAVKRTYALPQDIMEQFEKRVSPGKRSTMIAKAVTNWLEEERRAELRESIIEGCKEMWDVMLEIEKEYAPLDAEVARKYYDGD